jgi:DNA-binding transcriptional regulator YdaS (Cro superfamily)
MNAHPIISYRLSRGLSRAELAAKLGVKRAMIQHVENGVRKFSAERAMEIERATGVPRSVLRPDLWAEVPA